MVGVMVANKACDGRGGYLAEVHLTVGQRGFELGAEMEGYGAGEVDGESVGVRVVGYVAEEKPAQLVGHQVADLRVGNVASDKWHHRGKKSVRGGLTVDAVNDVGHRQAESGGKRVHYLGSELTLEKVRQKASSNGCTRPLVAKDKAQGRSGIGDFAAIVGAAV